MIEIEGVTKSFGRKRVIEEVSLVVPDATVYGLVGYNGAGKTTLLKIVAGVYRPDAGSVRIGGTEFSGGRASGREGESLFIVADDPFFLPQATPETMRSFYRGYYPRWSDAVYERLLALFGLDPTAKIAGFSKGMQRQLGILLGFSTGARVMLLDESFDGLDLGKRNLLKRLVRRYAYEKQASIILASHNLRELEDAADRLGMIKGSRLSFDGSVEEVRMRYPGASLEEIFLSEGDAAGWSQDVEGIFA